jgi:membrane fusion protein (multidrug efflux system)
MNKPLREEQLIGTAMAARRKSARRRIAILAMSLVVLAAAAWAGEYWWREGRWIETTDDAYVGGDTTALSSQVPGFISDVFVRDNQKVSAGDVLARIDERPYRAALDQARATVSQRRAALQNLHERLRLQDLVIEQAKADAAARTAAATFAGQEVERYRLLALSDAGSKQNAQKATAADEQAKSAVVSARAALAAATQQVKVLESDIAQAEASLAAAQAELQAAILNLEYTTIRSPIEGFVGNRAARVGAYVGSGAYLLSVVPSHGLWVDANFKEDQLRRLKAGQAAALTVDMGPDHILKGRVASVAPATGAVFSVIPPENATGNFTKIVQRVPVRIALDEGAAPVDLRPGLSVNVRIDTRQN